jgi:hypothetical protein
MKSKDTVSIAWTHAGEVDTEFALSVMEILRQKQDKIESYFCVEGLGLLAKSRNIVVKHFLDNTKADWLLMLDSDERISVPAFELLCATADAVERPVVAGLYFAALWEGSNIRPVPLIFKITKENGVQPYDNYPKNQVVDVDAAGTGCILIHRSALMKIRDGHDENNKDWCWFQDGPIGGNKWLSEDLSFCAKLGQFGIPMVAHTGAVLQHHKRIWVDESTYDTWASVNEPGTGLEQLQ